MQAGIPFHPTQSIPRPSRTDPVLPHPYALGAAAPFAASLAFVKVWVFVLFLNYYYFFTFFFFSRAKPTSGRKYLAAVPDTSCVCLARAGLQGAGVGAMRESAPGADGVGWEEHQCTNAMGKPGLETLGEGKGALIPWSIATWAERHRPQPRLKVCHGCAQP